MPPRVPEICSDCIWVSWSLMILLVNRFKSELVLRSAELALCRFRFSRFSIILWSSFDLPSSSYPLSCSFLLSSWSHSSQVLSICSPFKLHLPPPGDKISPTLWSDLLYELFLDLCDLCLYSCISLWESELIYNISACNSASSLLMVSKVVVIF